MGWAEEEVCVTEKGRQGKDLCGDGSSVYPDFGEGYTDHQCVVPMSVSWF